MDKKYICIIGVLDKYGSTQIPTAVSFMRHGYHVIPINYRTVIANRGNEFFEKLVLHTVQKYRPVLVMFCKCNGVNPELVTKCSKLSITYLHNPDPRPTIERCPEVIEHAKRAHFSSCTAKDMVEWFELEGVANCHHIIQGIDPYIFKPVEALYKYKADISFIGTKTPERDKYRKVLEDEGIDVKFYGNRYGGEVVEEDFASVCASSKFMLSINTYSNMHTEYFSNRLMRYLACGVCTLHLDDTGTLDKYFENYKDIIYFNDEISLMNALLFTKEEDIGKIALSGRERVLRTHTWDHKVRDILRIANKVAKDIVSI